MGQTNPTGYSAAVRLWLICGTQAIPLSHVGATYVIAKEPVDLHPGDAEIVFTVDDERYTRPIHLVNGMSKDHREAMVLSRDNLPF